MHQEDKSCLHREAEWRWTRFYQIFRNHLFSSLISITFQDGRDDEIFACHIKSPVCHPLGWSLEIGHDRREMPDDFYQDLKNNCVPAELFNQVWLDTM